MLDEEKEEKNKSNDIDNVDNENGEKKSLLVKAKSISDSINKNKQESYLNKKHNRPKDNDKNDKSDERDNTK